MRRGSIAEFHELHHRLRCCVNFYVYLYAYVCRKQNVIAGHASAQAMSADFFQVFLQFPAIYCLRTEPNLYCFDGTF